MRRPPAATLVAGVFLAGVALGGWATNRAHAWRAGENVSAALERDRVARSAARLEERSRGASCREWVRLRRLNDQTRVYRGDTPVGAQQWPGELRRISDRGLSPDRLPEADVAKLWDVDARLADALLNLRVEEDRALAQASDFELSTVANAAVIVVEDTGAIRSIAEPSDPRWVEARETVSRLLEERERLLRLALTRVSR